MCAGGKDGKTHLLFLLMSNGLRTVPKLLVFLVISNSDELGFLALRVFARFVFLFPSVGNLPMFWIESRLVKLCLTYSAGFWPLQLVRKPRLVSERARWVREDGMVRLLAWPCQGKSHCLIPVTPWNLFAYRLASFLCKSDVTAG